MLIHTIEEAISRLRYIQLDSDFPPSDVAHMTVYRRILVFGSVINSFLCCS